MQDYKNELGRSTWKFLHTFAEGYPNEPSEEEKKNIKDFFNIFKKVYPCKKCRSNLEYELQSKLNHNSRSSFKI